MQKARTQPFTFKPSIHIPERNVIRQSETVLFVLPNGKMAQLAVGTKVKLTTEFAVKELEKWMPKKYDGPRILRISSFEKEDKLPEMSRLSKDRVYRVSVTRGGTHMLFDGKLFNYTDARTSEPHVLSCAHNTKVLELRQTLRGEDNDVDVVINVGRRVFKDSESIEDIIGWQSVAKNATVVSFPRKKRPSSSAPEQPEPEASEQ